MFCITDVSLVRFERIHRLTAVRSL